MDNAMGMGDRLEFVVGAELSLRDLLDAKDAGPVLRSLAAVGPAIIRVKDASGAVLWTEGEPFGDSGSEVSFPLRFEGETIGTLEARFADGPGRLAFHSFAALAGSCLQVIILHSAKRLMATSVHTTVVNQSYEELQETNRLLAASEAQYRELAASLERKVEERSAELKRAHAVLLQQEKMASVGQLAAGVAHEINNPLGFIRSNIQTFGRYADNLGEMLLFFRGMTDLPAPQRRTAEENWRRLKIEVILGDIGELVEQSLEGTERITKIVAGLKGFSHIDEAGERRVEVNTELDRTLEVLSAEIGKRGAVVTRDYEGSPVVFGSPGLLCQAFLSIIMNALESREQCAAVSIRTHGRGEGAVVVEVADNGRGVPEEIRTRIFEPFFTTKPVGAGTGMGLSIAYEIITGLGGTLQVSGRQGGGSVFSITLPAAGELS